MKAGYRTPTAHERYVVAHRSGDHGAPDFEPISRFRIRPTASHDAVVLRRNHAEWCQCGGPFVWRWDDTGLCYVRDDPTVKAAAPADSDQVLRLEHPK